MRYTLLILVVALLCPTPGAGDVVQLKNGNRLEGQIVRATETEVTIKLRHGTITVQRSEVQSIERKLTPEQEYRKRLAALEMEDVAGHYKLAEFCLAQGLTTDAIRELRRILNVDPHYAPAKAKLRQIFDRDAAALYERAARLARRGDTEAALEACRKLLAEYAESTYAIKARTQLARYLSQKGDYAAAAREWRRVLEHDASAADAYSGLAECSLHLQQWQQARTMLEKLREVAEPGPTLKKAAHMCDLIDQVLACQKLATASPGDPEPHARLVSIYGQLGCQEVAVAECQVAAKKGSKNAAVLTRLARHHDDQFALRAAQSLWQQIARLGDARLAAEAKTRLERIKLLSLVPRYLYAADATERKEILSTLAAQEIVGVQDAERLIRAGAFYQPRATGMLRESLIVAEDGSEAKYALYVPEDYDPAKSYPLIVGLHEARGKGDKHVYVWLAHARAKKYFVLCPTNDPAVGWSGTGHSLVLSAIAKVQKYYNIDANRVCLEGVSLGAIGCWEIGLHNPSHFAAIVPRSGAPRYETEMFLANAAHLSVYAVHGAQDTMLPVSIARRAVDKLERMEADVTYREYKQGGHDIYLGENPRILEWLRTRKRNPYPARVSFTTCSLRWRKCFWIQIDELDEDVFDPERPFAMRVHAKLSQKEQERLYYVKARKRLARLEARIDPDNQISIATRLVRGVTLMLSDRLVDLDQPVSVRLNGRAAFHGPVKRSFETLLETARKTRDREMLFSAKLQLPQ